MKKSTTELLEMLKETKSIKDFIEDNEFSDITTAEYLTRIMNENNISAAEAAKRSNLAPVYVYKILSGERSPRRDKLLCLCFALKMTFDEVQRALKIAGVGALYPKVRRDSIIIFALNEGADLMSCNNMLYDLSEDVLE